MNTSELAPRSNAIAACIAPLFLLGALTPAAGAHGGSFGPERHYPIAGSVGGAGIHAEIITGDFTGDAVAEAAFMRRDASGDTAWPAMLYGTHLYDIAAELPNEATDFATLHDAQDDGTDAILTIEGDEIHRWEWYEDFEQNQFVFNELLPAYGGPWEQLTAIAIGQNSVNPWSFVAVSTFTQLGGHKIYTMLFLDAQFFAHVGNFSVPEAVLDLALCDLDGDGLRDEVVYVTSSQVTIREIDGSNAAPEDFQGTNVALDIMSLGAGPESVGHLSEDNGLNTLLVIGDGFVHEVEFSDWQVVSMTSGDYDEDGDVDVVLGTLDGDAVVLFPNVGGQTPFTPLAATELELEGAVNSGGVTPSLYDYDADGDLDLLAVSSASIHYFPGTKDNANEQKLFIASGGAAPPQGNGPNPPGQYDPEPSTPGEPEGGDVPVPATFTVWTPDDYDGLADRIVTIVHRSTALGEPIAGFEQVLSHYPDELDDAEFQQITIDLALPAYGPLPVDTTVFFIEFRLVYDGPPRYTAPIRLTAWSANEAVIPLLVEACMEQGGSTIDCLPKNGDYGAVDVLGFIPGLEDL